MYFHRVIVFLVLIAASVFTKAQLTPWENENHKTEIISVETDTVQLNSGVILPEKFEILKENGEKLSSIFYRIDYSKGQVIFDSSIIGERLKISYFIHPDLQKQSIFSKDTALIHDPIVENRYFELGRQNKKINNPFDGLNSRGSLVRGIRFGNNQSASVQSSLDLQLTGKLSEDIGINAVIADNNVPIQADGYTQQLKEFDKVYVELFNKNSKIRAGHLDIKQEGDFFGNFESKVTGLEVSTELHHSDDSSTRIFAAGSVSRGDYQINHITGQNGNQGPYKLKGKNEELYIIIVSGSEHIYIDGIELTRGEDQDYVINYNTGELTFTTKHLITDNTRITAEFIYSKRTYSQVLLYGGVEHESERLRIGGHFYSQGDSKNSQLADELTDEDKEVLSQAGNDPNLMFNNTAVPTEYDPDRILYKKITIEGKEIFEYSNDPNEQLYKVSFTFMGQNQGDYVQSSTEINGKIFTYVPPENGIKQGNYEPIRKLTPPERLRSYTFNAAYKLKNNGVVGIDFGLSDYDRNLFSRIDDEDNLGYAFRAFANKEFKSKNWRLIPSLELSFIQNKFRAIQKLRDVEFYRHFNIEDELTDTDQTYLVTGLEGIYKDSLRLNYQLHYLNNKNQYKGLKNDFKLNYQTQKNLAEVDLSLLNTTNSIPEPGFGDDNTKFLRYRALAQRRLRKTFWAGAQYSGESNKIEDHLNTAEGNHFSQNSFQWDEMRAMAGIGDSTKFNAQLTYYNRRDDSIRLGRMQRLTHSSGWIMEAGLINKQTHKLGLTAHYRSVKHKYEDNPNENFITGNITWFKSFLNNGLTLNAYYELGSGVEPQREFEYVKVTDGTGVYKWTDYNGDGIEQLDEFEVAEYQDEANYIRVYTNTLNYVNINKNKFNISLKVQPGKLFKDENKFIERWMLRASLQSDNAVLKEGKTLEWNPFVKSENALTKNQNLRAILNFNHGGKYKWSSSYTFSNQETMNFIFTGGESRDTRSHLLHSKYKALESLYFLGEIENLKTKGNSDLFASRRFEIDAWRLKPQITYQLKDKFSISLNYTYQNKNNKMGTESLKQSDLGTEIQWNDGSKSSLLGNFNYVKNNFNGNGQSVVGNQMMEGLKPGSNLVWQLLFQRQLNAFLSINLTYDGRKTPDNKPIHSGSVQIQARF